MVWAFRCIRFYAVFFFYLTLDMTTYNVKISIHGNFIHLDYVCDQRIKKKGPAPDKKAMIYHVLYSNPASGRGTPPRFLPV